MCQTNVRSRGEREEMSWAEKKIKRVNLRTRNSTERKELMSSLYPLYRAFFAPSFCSFVFVSVCLSHFILVSISFSFTHARTHIHTHVHPRTRAPTDTRIHARTLIDNTLCQPVWSDILDGDVECVFRNKCSTQDRATAALSQRELNIFFPSSAGLLQPCKVLLPKQFIFLRTC